MLKPSYKKTALDTLVNSGAQLLLIPLTFVRLPVLTKNLSTQEYGLWGLIFTTCSLALPFTSLGLGASMSRFLPGENEKERLQEGFYSVLTLRMLVTFAVAGGVYLFAEPLANTFFDGFVGIVQITSLFIVLVTLHGIYRRLLRILRKIGVLTMISILDGYVSIAMFAVLLYSGYGLMSIVFAQLVMKIAEISFLIYIINTMFEFFVSSLVAVYSSIPSTLIENLYTIYCACHYYNRCTPSCTLYRITSYKILLFLKLIF